MAFSSINSIQSFCSKQSVSGIPSGITIPPVAAYVETNGSTTVTNIPILWTFLSGSQGPQTAVITKYSATISNSIYSLLNGTYYSTSSSSLNSTNYNASTDTTTSGPHEYGFSCFDGCYAGPIIGTFGGNYYSWISNFTNYSQSSPYTYTGGTYFTTVSGTSYGGEYVQLQLPNAVVIKGFKIYYPVDNVCGLMRAVLAGSNDGSTWTLIYTLNHGDTRPTQQTNATYSFTNTTSYSYYRFICTGVKYDIYGTRLIGINELIFNT